MATMGIARSASDFLAKLKSPDQRPVVARAGTFNYSGLQVAVVGKDIRGGYGGGYTAIPTGLEIQLRNTERAVSVSGMKFGRFDNGSDGRGLTVLDCKRAYVYNCMFEGGTLATEGDDEFSVVGDHVDLRVRDCIIGNRQKYCKGLLVSPLSMTAATRETCIVECSRCDFRTPGIRNPSVNDATVTLDNCRLWRADQNVQANTGSRIIVRNCQFFSSRFPGSPPSVFEHPGLVRIAVDYMYQYGSWQSQTKPQVYLSGNSLDGRPAGRAELCRGAKVSLANLGLIPISDMFTACPDDTYFITGSD